MAWSLVKELNRRNVFRVAIAYVVLAWLTAQVAELLLDAFGAPPWVLKSLLALLLVGFPIVVFFAWAFELTPEGVKRESGVDRERGIAGQTGHKLDRAIIILLLLAVAWFAWDRSRLVSPAAPVAAEAEQSLANDALQVNDEDAPPVIAVLPFMATGSDDGGFLAAGLHDDLLTRLAKLEAFRVISRTSMMEYADSAKNMRQIGQELGADYILEGGVQSISGRVRVNAQLIDAAADQHIWAEIYDRELTAIDLFNVQSELALDIAGALHTVLSPGDNALMNEVPTENLDAYNAFLKGLHKAEEWGTFGGVTPIREGIAAYQEAVQLDPGFAEAWAQLSITLSFAFQVWGDPENANAAMAALTHARLLKPGLLEVDIAWAQYTYRVLREYQLALDVLESLGERLTSNGDALSMKAWLYRRLGQFDDAYETLQEARKLQPRNIDTLGNLIHYAVRVNKCEAARQLTEQVLSMSPDSMPIKAQVAQYELECPGDAVRAGELLRDLEFEGNFGGWILAQNTAFLARDKDRALTLIEENWPGTGPLSQVYRELFRAETLRYLSRDETAARKSIEAAGALLEETDNSAGVIYSESYAGARGWFHSLNGDVGATLEWIVEHKRRYRDEYKGDLAEEAKNHLNYAINLSNVGLHEEAVEELRIMLEQPGGHRFTFVDGFPEFDVLDDTPGYIALRERFGGPAVEGN